LGERRLGLPVDLNQQLRAGNSVTIDRVNAAGQWRDQRDWTVEKYRRFDRGERTAATSRRIALSKTEFNGGGGLPT
jgi:hypothetical protein